MRRRKLVIALAAAGMCGLLAGPAWAELHRVSVTLVTGQTLTTTIDVPPGASIESIEIPGLPAPVQSITDLGVIPPPTPAPASGDQAPDAPTVRYLRPFPVVRIRGSVAAGGANVTLLRVTAPSGAAVSVRCAGDGCPVRRLNTTAGRLRSFERFLRAGVRMTIRVHRRDYIGKYVRIRIRAGRAPARHDACVSSASPPPVPCPPL